MTLMPVYSRTIARFPPLLCSILNLLYRGGLGQPSRDPRTLRPTTLREAEVRFIIAHSYQVSTKS